MNVCVSGSLREVDCKASLGGGGGFSEKLESCPAFMVDASALMSVLKATLFTPVKKTQAGEAECRC